MDSRNQLTTNLEGTNHGQVEALIANSCIETTNEVGLHAHDLTIRRVNLTGRQTVSIIVASILHLNHTSVTTGLEDVHSSLFTLLPQTDLLPVVDYVDRIAYEPEVALIALLT